MLLRAISFQRSGDRSSRHCSDNCAESRSFSSQSFSDVGEPWVEVSATAEGAKTTIAVITTAIRSFCISGLLHRHFGREAELSRGRRRDRSKNGKHHPRLKGPSSPFWPAVNRLLICTRFGSDRYCISARAVAAVNPAGVSPLRKPGAGRIGPRKPKLPLPRSA